MIDENFNDSAVDNGNEWYRQYKNNSCYWIPPSRMISQQLWQPGSGRPNKDLYPLWQVIRSHNGRHRPVIPTSFHGHPMENSISFMITLDSHRSCYRLISVTTRWGVILNRKLHIGHSNGLVSSKITSKSFGRKSWNYAFFQKGRRDSASAHTAQEDG